MRMPGDPTSDLIHDRAARPSWTSVGPDTPSLEPHAHGTAPVAEGRVRSRSDVSAAGTLVRRTVSVATFASGLIEYIGWQIAQRAGATSNVVPLGEWFFGLLRNLGGATAIGLALACIVMLIPRFRKRPLRAASAAFAFGVAGFLGFLVFLISLAP